MDRLEKDFPTVLRTILENLGTADLARRCRLVNMAWNHEANQILSRRLIIPFHSLEGLQRYCQVFEYPIPPVSIRLESFCFEISKLERELEHELFGELEWLREALRRFTEVSGDNVRYLEAAISPIAIQWGNTSSDSSSAFMYEQLSKRIYESFPNLTILRLKIMIGSTESWSLEESEFNLEDLVRNLPRRELPNLEQLTFTVIGGATDEVKEKISNFIQTLLSSAQNLKAITSWSLSAKERLLLNFSSLTPSLRSLTIKDAELKENDLRLIASRAFSNLENVEITLGGNVSGDALKDFLQRFSPSLRSLYLSFPRKEAISTGHPPHSPRVVERIYPQFPPEGVSMKQLEQLTLEKYSNGAVVWGRLSKLQKLILRQCRDLNQICNVFHQDISGQLKTFDVLEFRNSTVSESVEEFPFTEPYQFSFLTSLTIACVPFPPLSTIFQRSNLLRHLTVSGCAGVNDKSICGIRSSLLEAISPVVELQMDYTAQQVEEMIRKGQDITREEAYVGDLKYLQSLSLNADLGDSSVLFGVVQCQQLKRLNLASWSRRLTWRTNLLVKYGLKFLVETRIQQSEGSDSSVEDFEDTDHTRKGIISSDYATTEGGMNDREAIYRHHTKESLLASIRNFSINPGCGITRATFHQATPHVFPDGGNQCAAICIAAIGKAFGMDCKSWNSHTLDEILRTGNEYYQSIATTPSNPLLPSDASGTVSFPDGFEVTLAALEAEYWGCLDVVPDNRLRLQPALEAFFRSDWVYAIVTTGGASMALLKQNGSAYLFDSHSRDEFGCISPTGRACLLKVKLEDASLFFSRVIHYNLEGHFRVSMTEFQKMDYCFVIQPVVSHSFSGNDSDSSDMYDTVEAEHAAMKDCQQSVAPEFDVLQKKMKYIESLLGITYDTSQDVDLTSSLRNRMKKLQHVAESFYSNSNDIEISSQANVEAVYSTSSSQAHSQARHGLHEDPTLVVLQLATTPYTQAKCIICSEKTDRRTVKLSAVEELWIKERIFIHLENRCCATHYENGRFMEAAKEVIRTKKEINSVTLKNKDFLKFLNCVSDLALARPGIASFTKDTDTAVYHKLLGVSKETFEVLHDAIQPHLRNSFQRTTRDALAIFLCRLRLGLSQTVLGHLFAIDAQSSISYTIKKVQKALVQHFVPKYLGFQSISRARVKDKTNVLATGILELQDEQIALVLDGTYVYVQKSADHELQRKTWSVYKGRHLVKIMKICTTDGYIVDVVGPFGAKCNDGRILGWMMTQEEGLSKFVASDDVFVLDRGFRDANPILAAKGIRHVEPRNIDPKEKRLTAEDGTFSRGVTILRWVVEADNGWIKLVFHFFANVVPNCMHACMDEIMDYYRIACAIHNLVAPPLTTDPKDHEDIVKEYHERSGLCNLLRVALNEQRLDLPRAAWDEVERDSPHLADFPRLTESDLKGLTRGQFQIDQGYKYASSFWRIFLYRHREGLLRVRIRSRHSSSEYFCWIEYDHRKKGRSAIVGYCCDCMSGDRPFGMCSHLASACWFFGIRRYDPTPIRECTIGRTILDAASYVMAEYRQPVEAASEHHSVDLLAPELDEEMPTLDPVIGSQIPLPTGLPKRKGRKKVKKD